MRKRSPKVAYLSHKGVRAARTGTDRVTLKYEYYTRRDANPDRIINGHTGMHL